MEFEPHNPPVCTPLQETNGCLALQWLLNIIISFWILKFIRQCSEAFEVWWDLLCSIYCKFIDDFISERSGRCMKWVNQYMTQLWLGGDLLFRTIYAITVFLISHRNITAYL